MLRMDCTSEVRTYVEQALSQAQLFKAQLARFPADPNNAVRSSAMEILAVLQSLHALAWYARSQECYVHGPPSPWVPIPDLGKSINEKLAAYSDEPYQFRCALEAAEQFAFRIVEHSLMPDRFSDLRFHSAWVRWWLRSKDIAAVGPDIPFPRLIEGLRISLEEIRSRIDSGRLTVMRPDPSEP